MKTQPRRRSRETLTQHHPTAPQKTLHTKPFIQTVIYPNQSQRHYIHSYALQYVSRETSDANKSTELSSKEPLKKLPLQKPTPLNPSHRTKAKSTLNLNHRQPATQPPGHPDPPLE